VSEGVGLAVEELKHLAGGERCFVVGGDHGLRSWGEPTTPSSWPTGSSASLMAGHHPSPKCASSGRCQLFTHSQNANHHNRTQQKLPDHTKAILLKLAHSIHIVVS